MPRQPPYQPAADFTAENGLLTGIRKLARPKLDKQTLASAPALPYPSTIAINGRSP